MVYLFTRLVICSVEGTKKTLIYASVPTRDSRRRHVPFFFQLNRRPIIMSIQILKLLVGYNMVLALHTSLCLLW